MDDVIRFQMPEKELGNRNWICILKKKQIGLIAPYYLSGYSLNAVKALRYSGWNKAFKELGELLYITRNSIIDMRDKFDPYFNNHRVGWY